MQQERESYLEVVLKKGNEPLLHNDCSEPEYLGSNLEECSIHYWIKHSTGKYRKQIVLGDLQTVFCSQLQMNDSCLVTVKGTCITFLIRQREGAANGGIEVPYITPEQWIFCRHKARITIRTAVTPSITSEQDR